MIFFIVSVKRRQNKNWQAIKDGSAKGPLDYKEGGDFVIIAWNEVFPTLDELKKAVFAVAKTDPVCLDIRAQAIARFGIDPCLEEFPSGNVDKKTMTEIVDRTFVYWAHPCIGNITLSQRHVLRPSPVGSEPLLNWTSCKLLDADTVTAVTALTLPKMLGPIDRSRRDQVRICTSVTELARAIIGEISCEATRRLEKLFALRLCRSSMLLKEQQDLLVAWFDAQRDWITQTLPKSFIWGKCEYTKYYLGTPKESDRWPLFTMLLDDATGGRLLKTKPALSPEARDKYTTWQLLPTTIRCAVLMNDLRKVSEYTDQPAGRTSMCMVKDELPLGRGMDPAYTIGKSADKVLELAFKNTQWGLAWSWNRDEYAMATKTYRHFLCPLWAGSSGHTNGALMFWEWAIGKKLSGRQTAAVVTGLFTLWRLYYDKRFGANHTLAETFEASGGPFAVNPRQLTVPSKVEIPKIGLTDDAFLLIQQCWGKRSFGDPILILHAIGESYLRTGTFAEQFAALKTDIDKERVALTFDLKFTVPVWSWSLEPKEGLATTSFAQRQLASSPSPLASVAVLPKQTQVIATPKKKDGETKKKDTND